MALADLYCLAGAPLLSTCLDSRTHYDITIEGIIKELNMLMNFSGCGFKNFIIFFERAKAKNETGEFTAALACLAAFCARLQGLLFSASNVARALQGQFQPNSSLVLKEYEAKAKSEGLNPSDQQIGDLLDTDKDAEWNTHAMRRGKVEFTEEAKSGHENQQSSGKATSGARKQGRKATQHAKRNGQIDHAYTSDEDDFSTSGSIIKGPSDHGAMQAGDSHSEKAAAFVVQRQHAATPGSAWSLWDPCKSCWGSQNEHLTVTKYEVTLDLEDDSLRRESSVHISGIQEIDDDKGDSRWNELPRRLQRFDRIRKRVPTGHPKLMKDSSEEALGALAAEDTEERSGASEHLTQPHAVTSAEPPDDVTLSGDRIAVFGRVPGSADLETFQPHQEPVTLMLTHLREFRVF